MSKAQVRFDEGTYHPGLVCYAHAAAGQNQGASGSGVPVSRRTIRHMSYRVHTLTFLSPGTRRARTQYHAASIPDKKSKPATSNAKGEKMALFTPMDTAALAPNFCSAAHRTKMRLSEWLHRACRRAPPTMTINIPIVPKKCLLVGVFCAESPRNSTFGTSNCTKPLRTVRPDIATRLK